MYLSAALGQNSDSEAHSCQGREGNLMSYKTLTMLEHGLEKRSSRGSVLLLSNKKFWWEIKAREEEK